MTEVDAEQLAEVATTVAHDVLIAAISGDVPLTSRRMDVLAWLGPTAVGYAVQVWIDLNVDHATDGAPDVIDIHVHTWNPKTGQIEDEESIDKIDAWIERLIAARANRDREAFYALIGEIPDDERSVSRYVSRALDNCARSIANMPRGYALLTAEMRDREQGEEAVT